MPTLDWIGKQAVVNHDREVPYRLLHCDAKQSAGNPDTGNLIVQGDNLNALKALLPYYAGKVKCIYIDPPYNTGNEGWVYNDNVNAPEIKRWLGKTVGKEAEDLSRHDKWLCMMYPRLKLLRDFLSEDGLLFISLDDNEYHHLRNLCDEIFGGGCFIADAIWEKSDSPRMDAVLFSSRHDHTAVYAKSPSQVRVNRLRITDDELPKHYNKRTADGMPYYLKPLRAMGSEDAKENRPSMYFPLIAPDGTKVLPVRSDGTDGRWRWGQERVNRDKDEIEWVSTKDGWSPYYKVKFGENAFRPPETVWRHETVGSNRTSKKEIKAIFGDEKNFDTPKPLGLLKRILQIASDPDSLILDSFAGSGTTMHAVMQLNREDGGNRRCIMVEMEEKIAKEVTSERIRRVMQQDGKRDDEGFRYCTLGDPLFAADGTIRVQVKYRDLAHHIYFTETGRPLPKITRGPKLGEDGERTIYLLFNGVMGDKSVDGGNILTRKTLEVCGGESADAGPRTIYGEGCRLSAATLRRLGVTFKQLPYDVKVS